MNSLSQFLILEKFKKVIETDRLIPKIGTCYILFNMM